MARGLRDHDNGFTLIELLIGMVLLIMMLGVLFSGLRLGARVWDRTEQTLASLSERDAAMQFIVRQIELARPAFIIEPGQERTFGFSGENDNLGWSSPLPAHRGGGLHFLTLEVGETDRGAGLVLGYRLLHPDVENSADTTRRELLLPQVKGLTFEYFGHDPEDPLTDRWFETWQDRFQLPELVRVGVVLSDDSEKPLSRVAAPRLVELEPLELLIGR